VAVFFALFFIVLPFIYFRLVWFEARVIIKIKTKCFIFCLLLLADRISKQAEILFKVARNNNNSSRGDCDSNCKIKSLSLSGQA